MSGGNRVRPRCVGALAALALGAVCAGAARADGSEPVVEIERMTWPEIAARRESGALTVIVPTGGVEQNGPHMATGKHNFIVRETARRVALALGDALVAPVLAYVPEGDPARAEGHMAYPGTVSLRPATFEAVLTDAATSFRTQGFRRIVFLGDSGGNIAPQQRVAAALSRRWRRAGVVVLSADAYYADNGGADYLAAEGFSPEEIAGHAGLRDTSELMAVAPDAVWPDAAAPGMGAEGAPQRARADLGARLIDLKVAAALAEIRSVAPPPAP